MAINYNKVGWDTTKYFNPSNMNHMDDGIKAACDKADANESAISSVSDRVTNNEKAIAQANSNLLPKTVDLERMGSWTGNILIAKKSGNIATIYGNGLKNTVASERLSVLPESLRPPYNVQTSCASSKKGETACVSINLNGEIFIAIDNFYDWYTTGTEYSFAITYVI